MISIDKDILHFINLIYEKKLLNYSLTIKELILIYKIEMALYELSKE